VDAECRRSCGVPGLAAGVRRRVVWRAFSFVPVGLGSGWFRGLMSVRAPPAIAEDVDFEKKKQFHGAPCSWPRAVMLF